MKGGGKHGGGGGHRPGNYGGTESRDYEEVYDPRDQKYTSAAFLESGDQVRLDALRGRDQDSDAYFAPDSHAVHFWPSVGKFIIPTENTWAAHAELVRDKRNNLFFSPDKYLFFDKIIAERMGNPALTNPAHADYAKFEGLRTNLAVMRNDIIGIYLNDGSFDPGDEKYVPLIQGIAETLGDALGNDKWYKRSFTRAFNTEVANVEGVGAQELYKFLTSVQMKPGLFNSIKRDINELLDFPDNDWRLPPLEYTPYSRQNLMAPPPGAPKKAPPGPPAAPDVGPFPGGEPSPEEMIIIADRLNANVVRLRSVDDMQEPAREESVDEARRILRWLRNMEFSEKEPEEWLGHGSHTQQLAKAESVEELVRLLARQVADARRRDPSLVESEEVSDAMAAASALAYGVSLHAVNVMPEGHPATAHLDGALDRLESESGGRHAQSAERLLSLVENGMARLAGKPIVRTPAQRLVEMSARSRESSRQLRSVESMEEPAREESVELAREILRRLRNMSFSDKPVAEAIDAGRPEDKAALAEKFEEVIGTYRNLMAEAARIDPSIMEDEQVKEANDAVAVFTHAIALMAAKEMPNSVAAAAQIGAAQTSEDIAKLNDRTVDRLVQTMEGGMEKAIGAIAAQQEEQQQQDDLSQEAAGQNQTEQGEQGKRKKRKKRQRGAGLTKAAKRRNAGDLNGDGIADKFQGINVGQSGTQTVTLKLDAKDLEAIKSLGGSLRDIGKQLKNLGGIANVAATDKIAPDDKTAAQRAIESELQKRNKPSSPQMG